MNDRNKVIPINSQLSGSGPSDDSISQETASMDDGSHLFARLPAPFTEMKDKGKQALQPLLQSLFDNIDDALFELADRAEQNAEQNMYFESMREIRIRRRGIELGFGRELDNAFLQLLAMPDDPPVLSSGDVVSVDGLSLVQEDELEELVAIDGMVAKAVGNFAPALDQLTTRLDTLIENQEVTTTNNPFGPRSICEAFTTQCRGLEIDIKAKLVLFKLFDRYVMGQLGLAYQACNQVLIQGGILPTLAMREQKQQQKKTAEPSTANQAADQEAVFNDLQNLLHASDFEAPSGYTANGSITQGLAAPGQAPMIPREQLMQLLKNVQQSLTHQLEQQQQVALQQGVSPEQLDIQSSLNNLLTTKMPAQPMSIGQVDDDTINLVAMLFQFILEDRNLAAAMKAMIARLQIPIIKVAMQDKAFFSKGGHPARKLLNEIAQASMGWVPGNKIDRDPLYKKVSESVNRIVDEFETDTRIFQEVLTDFMAFLEADQKRSQMVEQRTVTAEDGKAKSEIARTTVQQILNDKVAGKSIPKTVVTLLEQGWSNVLFLICLKEGTEDKNWQDALSIVDDLIWSVEPIEGIEQRQKLMAMIPVLLKNLRKGLDKIGYNPVDMDALFADLETIHMEQMKEPVQPEVAEPIIAEKPADKEPLEAPLEQSLDQLLEARNNPAASLEELDAELDEQLGSLEESTETEAVATPATETVAREVVEKLVINGAAEEQADEIELADDDPCLDTVDAMTMGIWVELHQEGDKKFRARLAAVIRGTGKYIFVNRAGMKVAEYQRKELALALKQGSVSLLDEGQLFDRALESVIGNLRNMRSSG